MPLSSDLHQRLQAVLLRCGSFASDRALWMMFVDARLAPWQDALPEAASPQERVRAVIAALVDQSNAHGENALALLLRVLSENTPPGNACHWDLAELAQEVAEEKGEEPAPSLSKGETRRGDEGERRGGQPAGTQINLSGTFSGPVSVGGAAIDARGSQGAVINPSGSVMQTLSSASVPAPSPPADPAVRARLSRLDDVQLDTLCLDHFPEVYDQFSRGLRRDEKLNLLANYIRNHPETAAHL